MPRYARMLSEGMRARGYEVKKVTATPFFFKLPLPGSFKKWLGYMDQYLVFPVLFKLKKSEANTLYVFADQALGPWVPLVKNKPHVIHCHDFLAQRSALGELAENKTGKTGRWYQEFIRRGYQQGKYFISISKKSQQDLHQFLTEKPLLSEVVYNGLNQPFNPDEPYKVREMLSKHLNIDLSSGYLLHVGGNQFYKNRLGVLEIVSAYRMKTGNLVPLVMVGSSPTEDLLLMKNQMSGNSTVYFFSGLSDELVRTLYQGALVMIYPSLEEGFGWPIAEAQASGCPVITTGKPPMNEVGGDAALYIPRKSSMNMEVFLESGVAALQEVLGWSEADRADFVSKGLLNAKRFDTDFALQELEAIYNKVFQIYQSNSKH